ncbi:MAG: hypothetical protein ACI814_004015 [Mariniblastus sp.]|jgi:hypothetical protein
MSDLDAAGLATVRDSQMVPPKSCDSGYDSNLPNGPKPASVALRRLRLGWVWNVQTSQLLVDSIAVEAVSNTVSMPLPSSWQHFATMSATAVIKIAYSTVVVASS